MRKPKRSNRGKRSKVVVLAIGIAGLFISSSHILFENNGIPGIPVYEEVTHSIDLHWDKNPESIGYNIYQGNERGSYEYYYQAGDIDSARIGGLLSGQSYTFVITSFNEEGLESFPSEELLKIIPVDPIHEIEDDYVNIWFPDRGDHLFYRSRVSYNLVDWGNINQSITRENDFVLISIPVIGQRMFFKIDTIIN